MDAAITVIRGVVLSAERAWELTEAATAAGGEDDFDDVLAPAGDKLTYEAPISRLGGNYAGAGNDVVVVGAPLGMRDGYEFAVLRIDTEPTILDGYTGKPKEPIQCKLSDAEIVEELNKCGILCTEDDLGSFVVVWTGYS